MSIRMKLTRQQIVPWVTVVFLVGGLAVAIMNPVTFLRRGVYQGEIRALCDSVQLDMTRDQVRRSMDTAKYPHLEFRQVEDDMWFASAPYEFGAQSWVLVIDFHGERVSAIRVRTHDGLKEFQRPAKAPADRVNPSVGRSRAGGSGSMKH